MAVSAGPPSSNANANPAIVAGATIAGVVIVLMIAASIFVLRRRRLARIRRAGCINLNPPESEQRFAYPSEEEDCVRTTTNAASYGESLSLGTYLDAHPSPTGSHDDLLPISPQESSLSDLSVPLLPSIRLQSDTPPDRKLPRFVVTGTETRLEGPDNSMARIARQRVAEREAELTGRAHEV